MIAALALAAALQDAPGPIVTGGARVELRMIVAGIVRPYQDCTSQHAIAAMQRRNIDDYSIPDLYDSRVSRIRGEVANACAPTRQEVANRLDQLLLGRPGFSDVSARRAAIDLLLLYSDRTTDRMIAGYASSQSAEPVESR